MSGNPGKSVRVGLYLAGQMRGITRKDTHCLAFSLSGGQCASCSRRTSALEAVQLSAIPVKRTAAASDEHVWVQARSSATCLNYLVLLLLTMFCCLFIILLLAFLLLGSQCSRQRRSEIAPQSWSMRRRDVGHVTKVARAGKSRTALKALAGNPPCHCHEYVSKATNNIM